MCDVQAFPSLNVTSVNNNNSEEFDEFGRSLDDERDRERISWQRAMDRRRVKHEGDR